MTELDILYVWNAIATNINISQYYSIITLKELFWFLAKPYRTNAVGTINGRINCIDFIQCSHLTFTKTICANAIRFIWYCLVYKPYRYHVAILLFTTAIGEDYTCCDYGSFIAYIGWLLPPFIRILDAYNALYTEDETVHPAQ